MAPRCGVQTPHAERAKKRARVTMDDSEEDDD
jgi:hypothetical protein